MKQFQSNRQYLWIWRLVLSVACLTPNSGICDVLDGDLRVSLKGTTNYIFRGISQTDGGPAIQAGVDFEHSTGVFGGLWGSNVEFQRDQQVDNPRNIELNYYFGFNWLLNPSWSAVYSVTYYSYPSSSVDADFIEFTATASFEDHIFATVSYSPDGYFSDSTTINYEVGGQYPLFERFMIGAHLGVFDFKDSRFRTYKYWDIGISGGFRFVMIDLRYHDTNSAARESFHDYVADSEWVFSISTGLHF